MTNLSVNINKIATLRNARGENVPNVEQVAIDCESFGANGITVHPRPDERHIRHDDVFALRPLVKTEFNIEGYPSPEFLDLVLKVKPEQVTLVPDAPDAITSSAGWNVKENMEFLTDIVDRLRDAGIRSSIFVDTDIENIKDAAATGADRVELCRLVSHQSRKSGGSLRRGKPRSPQGRSWRKCRSRPQPRQPEVLPRACTVPQRSVDRTCADIRCTVSRTERNNQAIQGVPCLR